MYYTILYYTILYYTTLHYTILYYTILYYTILYYTILYYTILYYTTIYTILYYTILYYTILYYTTILYTILCYTRSGSCASAGPSDSASQVTVRSRRVTSDNVLVVFVRTYSSLANLRGMTLYCLSVLKMDGRLRLITPNHIITYHKWMAD